MLYLFFAGIAKSYGSNGRLHSVKNIIICPLINDANISITPSSCNGSDGKILGMSGSGTGILSYTWLDVNNKIVGTDANLVNVPAGTYKVQLRDESKCIAVERDGYVVPLKNQVVINVAKAVVKSPDCNQSDGSITNVSATNAVSYQWFDGAGNLIANTANLTNIATGSFKLIATNADGCSEQNIFQVTGTGSYPTISSMDTIQSDCGSPDKLNLTFNLSSTDPLYRYFLLDPAGNNVQQGIIAYTEAQPTSITLTLPANIKFRLVVTDPSNCQTVIGTYSLGPAKFYIDTSLIYIRNDACGAHTGAIIGLHMVGAVGVPPPVKFTWTDANGNVVGQFLELTSIGAGTYTLSAIHKNGCSDSKTFTVTDTTANAVAPIVNNISMCLPGVAVITVNNTDGVGSYKLYDSTRTYIETNAGGRFGVNVEHTTQYYVSHTINTCESTETPVTVSVAAPGIKIPNAFTPNGDGINDYWNIKGIDQFAGATVNIFNRNGQLVFHSIGYPKPFNGLYGGKRLPTGVYYYTIDVKLPQCFGKISGDLTIIR